MSNRTTTKFTLPSRDKYGRSCHDVFSGDISRQIGGIVRLPKPAIEMRGDDAKYLSCDWQMPFDAEDRTRYHRTLSEARARFAAIDGRKRFR